MIQNPMAKSELLNLIYPIGSVYINVQNVSPEDFLGGVWEQIQGRFLLAMQKGRYAAGETGGEETHLLNTNELPTYTSGSVYTHNTNTDKTSGWISPSEGNNIGYGPLELGGNQPHNNMPPYLVVYMWKRTG